MLPLRRGANLRFFVLTRPVYPSDGLLDPILGPLGAVLSAFLGLLGLSWAILGGRTSHAEGPEEACRGSLELSWAVVGVFGIVGGLVQPSGGPFGPPFGCFSVHFLFFF